MTDEQAVKGRWLGAYEHVKYDGTTRIYTYNAFICNREPEALFLGRDWHEARQHPSVVEWEAAQAVSRKELEQWQSDLAVLPDNLRHAIDPLVRVFASKETTIVEQAARIAELELRVEGLDCANNYLADEREALQARVAELEKERGV